ncbi:hypothetical protein ACQKNB_16315 [Lysinibacillus xylanilyticus]|uniref:hypothetical protein n=1 Tax=Lysinibacillus xylanilyticus TaxID=582475 RepID=UPI003D047CC2
MTSKSCNCWFYFVKNALHQGQDLGIQLFDHSKLTMNGCEVKQHLDTNLVIHKSEILVTDFIFSQGQGNKGKFRAKLFVDSA